MSPAFVSAIPLPSRRVHHAKSPLRAPKMVLRDPKPARSSQDSISDALSMLRASPVVLCIRFKDSDTAMHAATAALEGGLRCMEVTMTTPDAADIIAELRKRYPEALIGAGTVLTPSDVDAVHRAGGLFALSPILDPSIVAACHDLGLLAVPGATTPTEIWNAYNTGARLVKVFPTVGELGFIRALQGPLGQIPLLPTYGISATLLPQYLAEPNVVAVGLDRLVLPREAIDSGDWEVVKQQAKKCADVIAKYATT